MGRYPENLFARQAIRHLTKVPAGFPLGTFQAYYNLKSHILYYKPNFLLTGFKIRLKKREENSFINDVESASAKEHYQQKGDKFAHLKLTPHFYYGRVDAELNLKARYIMVNSYK